RSSFENIPPGTYSLQGELPGFLFLFINGDEITVDRDRPNLQLDAFQDLPLLNGYVPSPGAPNDTGFGLLWGLDNRGQLGDIVPGIDIRALEAWKITPSYEAPVVAVIDSGVDYGHPDLIQNIFRNEGEIPHNGIDDDGDG